MEVPIVTVPAALVQCRKSGFSDEQAQRFVLVCDRFGVEMGAALAAVRSVAMSSAMSISDAAAKLCEVVEARTPLERPDLSAILAAQKPNRAERRRDDHRRRSMKQPTGMPWDRRS